MTIKELNTLREALGMTYQEICFASGVPISTIQKVFNGTTRNPRMDTLNRIESALRQRQHAIEGAIQEDRNSEDVAKSSPAASYGRSEEGAAGMVQEAPAQYNAGNTARKVPHIWTAAQRELLPDDRRTELIDGVLYDMASPATTHQTISMEIYIQIRQCIKEHSDHCYVFAAPTDVYLDRDEYTVVQPDVFIICDKDQINRKNIQGAPAFILEVLSPSTKKKDQTIKLMKYVEAGVREYWIIDPAKEHVIVYDMRDNTPDRKADERGYDVGLYGFRSRIPILISEGKCTIDMNAVAEELKELYS